MVMELMSSEFSPCPKSASQIETKTPERHGEGRQE